ncbi:Reverse transcriptase domain-containing protein, partial [Aphis craccivora]
LHIPKVTETANLYYSKFRNRLQNHPNPHIKKLLSISIPGNPQEDSNDNGPVIL